MGVARRVHHLRLRGPSEAAIRRAALKLEDALRTASLPDAGARIVLVRRVALGRIDADAAPATLALTWERMMARADWRCVHGRDAQAGSAAAVWFADALDAHVALALRLLRGPEPHEWFWPLAVPGWHPPGSVLASLRAIAHALLAREEAASALPAWCAELARAGQAARLPEVFADGDVAAPRRWFAHLPGMDKALGVDERGPTHLPSPPAPNSFASPNCRGARIAAALLAAGGEHAWAARLLRDAVAEMSNPCMAALVTGQAKSRRTAMRNPERDALRGARIASESRTSEALVTPTVDALTASIAPADEADIAESAACPEWPPSRGTAAGGIGFLLPVLQRLGYPEWVRAQPGWNRHAVLQRVLASVLARLDIPADDPAWALPDHRQRRGRLPRSFIAPARWRDGLLCGDGVCERDTVGGGCITDASGRLLLAAWRGQLPKELRANHSPSAVSIRPNDRDPPRDLLDATTHAWTTALHRWLRRHARIGLHELVCRPAHLALTATHLDLHFHPSQADLRLRRHGLDLDPGWLPWFGRVVAFHYQNEQST